MLYENTDHYEQVVRKELTKPGLNLGLGIDCSDSLLYEGETGLARRLIPLFTSKKTNPFGRKLILLTKSINVHYLEGLSGIRCRGEPEKFTSERERTSSLDSSNQKV